jgi:plastocyanin
MLRYLTILTIALVLLPLVGISCAGEESPPTSHGEPTEDHVSLVNNLRATGATVELAGDINQPFFSVEGSAITVNGENVQVFEYSDDTTAKAEAETIAPDGSSIGTSIVSWVAPPHFYQKDRIIVLYVGTNQGVLNFLEQALGAQIAGGSTAALPPLAPTPSQPEFSVPKKSPHWESNTPEHGATLAAVPINIVIDFNFDLGPGSDISIMSNGEEYSIGQTVVDENKLAMRRNMDQDAPDGLYKIAYKACWPDGSCHDGYFEFAIDRSKESAYEDLRGQGEITVTMKGIAFIPQNVLISKGTRITWINEDSVTHYVNTDSHPAHTYYPEMNSLALNNGDNYSLILDIPGIYPYHCSAHTNMKGSIIVE